MPLAEQERPPFVLRRNFIFYVDKLAICLHNNG